jgi:hypothetical protein
VDPGSRGSVALVVPAESSGLSLVRLFATAVGRLLSLSLESVEDLKLALTELCAEAIEDASTTEPAITVEVETLVDPPIFWVKSSAGRQFHPQRGDVGDRRRSLLEAMLPGLEPTSDASGVRFPFPVALSPRR